MITDELLAYIKKGREVGATPAILRDKLKQNGWAEADINEAFTELGIIEMPVAPAAPISTPPANPVAAKPAAAATQPIQPVQPQAEVKPVEDFDQGIVIKEKKRGHFGLIATIFILVLVGGGLAYGYNEGYFFTLDSVVDEAWTSARASKSGTFDTTIRIDASSTVNGESAGEALMAGAMTKGSVTLRGSYDVSTENNLKFVGDASIDFGLMKGSADFRIVNQNLYAKLGSLSGASYLPVEEYTDKWISFDYKSDRNPGAMLSMLPFGGFDPSAIKNLTPEEQQEILDITNRADFIKVTDKMLPEKMGDVLSYHFHFVLDREGIKNYLLDLKVYLDRVGKEDSYLSSLDPTELGAELDNILDFQGEAWVGIKDRFPYKFNVSFAIDSDKAEPGSVKVTLVSVFKDWNQPVAVEAPAESTTFEELMKAQMNSFGEDAPAADIDAETKGLMTSLRADAEIYFDKTGGYKDFCFDSGEGVQIMFDKIFENSNEGNYFDCKDDVKTYAVSTQLRDLSYFCVDSTGYAGTVPAMISGTVCPK